MKKLTRSKASGIFKSAALYHLEDSERVYRVQDGISTYSCVATMLAHCENNRYQRPLTDLHDFYEEVCVADGKYVWLGRSEVQFERFLHLLNASELVKTYSLSEWNEVVKKYNLYYNESKQ